MLTEAAIMGKRDELRGLKENVIAVDAEAAGGEAAAGLRPNRPWARRSLRCEETRSLIRAPGFCFTTTQPDISLDCAAARYSRFINNLRASIICRCFPNPTRLPHGPVCGS